MSTSTTPTTTALVLVQITSNSPTTYSLNQAAQLGHIHPEMLRFYCQIGLLGTVRNHVNSELQFDDDAIYALRRLEHYRRHHGVQRRTLRVLGGLWCEIDRLNAEVRFLRAR